MQRGGSSAVEASMYNDDDESKEILSTWTGQHSQQGPQNLLFLLPICLDTVFSCSQNFHQVISIAKSSM